MSVYRHPSNPALWMIKISHGRKGKAEYIPYHGDKDGALILEREIRGQADRSDPAFLDLLPDFKIAYKNRVRENTYKSLEYSLLHLKPFFGGFRIRHIVPSLIERYKAKRLAAGVKKRTINIELSALSAYITWINESTGSAYPLPKRFGKRETAPDMPQVLTIDELIAILRRLDGDLWLMAALMGLCGLRKNEVVTLTAGQVDIDGRTIRVVGKGGRWRMVPVGWQEIIDRLRAQVQKNPAGPLFVSPRTGKQWVNIKSALQRAAKEAKITKKIGPHLFRHSFATALINDGTDIRIIQELLGHSELATTQIYTQVAATSKRAAVTRLVANVANTEHE